jgi:hypothetical protein
MILTHHHSTGSTTSCGERRRRCIKQRYRSTQAVVAVFHYMFLLLTWISFAESFVTDIHHHYHHQQQQQYKSRRVLSRSFSSLVFIRAAHDIDAVSNNANTVGVAVKDDEALLPSETDEANSNGSDTKNLLDSAATNNNNLTQTTKTSSSSLPPFQVLAGNMANTLIQSDLKRNSGLDGASAGWTSWIDEKSAFYLQSCIDKLYFTATRNSTNADDDDGDNYYFDDDWLRWTRWIKACPSPRIMELSCD